MRPNTTVVKAGLAAVLGILCAPHPASAQSVSAGHTCPTLQPVSGVVWYHPARYSPARFTAGDIQGPTRS